MNKHGAAGTTGFKAEDVVAFLDAHRLTLIRAGHPRQTINGIAVTQNNARVIRRWRNEASGVTRRAAEKVFWAHSLTLTDFSKWLKKQ